MTEEWVELPGYGHYAVSTHGRVMNINRDHVLHARPNAQGISMVSLIDDEGVRVTRSVALLIARTFVPRDYRPTFDAPINLNGDRMDCRIENLIWRPRWFAVRFHAQFGEERFHRDDVEIQLVGTDEIYQGWKPPCVAHGILYRQVIETCHNRDFSTYPTHQRFRIVKKSILSR